jgi:hypothetical protein
MARDALGDFSGAVEMARSGLEYRHGREPLEPVGAGREHGGHAVPPAVAGAGVLDGEGAVAQQGLDPRPFASPRDVGAGGSDPVHQVVLHRIGGRVDQLVDHGLAVDEPDDAGLLR